MKEAYQKIVESLKRDYGKALPGWVSRPPGAKVYGDDRYSFLQLLAMGLAGTGDLRFYLLESERRIMELDNKYKSLFESYGRLQKQVLALQDTLGHVDK